MITYKLFLGRVKPDSHCYGTARTVTARNGTTKYYIISLYEVIHIDTDDTAPSRYSTDRTDRLSSERMF